MLAGEQTIDQIVLNPLAWYADNGITLHTRQTVTHIDRTRRIVRTAAGVEAAYDRLLLATGSMPFMLPVPGKDLDGRHRLPRHRRHAGDDRRGGEVQDTRWSSAAGCSAWKPPTA